ncbi:MAG: butyrate kinase, partial [Clostridiales bacterium]|nr:butyrate kinase [Clostridiales bacterium]
MEKKFRMLVINPGSTSTKIAVFENTQQIFEKKLMHSAEEIGQFERVVDQYEFRKKNIIDAVNENNMDLSEFDAVMGRGGLTQPVVSGVYIINEKMLEQVKSCRYGEHAANLGPILASEIAGEYNIPSFIADP